MKKLISFILLLTNYCYSQIPQKFGISCSNNDIQFNLKETIDGSCSIVDMGERKFDALFIPLSSYPNYILNVNFIFIQRADGSGNFQQNNSDHLAIIDQVINELNNAYTNLIDPHDNTCYAGTNFVSDAKIRFNVNKIFVRDNYGWNNLHGSLCPGDSQWYLNYLDSQINSNPNIRKSINIYFTEDSLNYYNLVINRTTDTFTGTQTACSQYPSFDNITRTSRIHMPNMYSKFWYMKNIIPAEMNQPWDPVVKGWYVSTVGRGLAHELGHSLWLFHSSPYYATNTCFYTIMNQCGTCPRNYLPPSEIGRMHASLILSNVSKYVSIEYNPIAYYILNSQIWNTEMKFYQSIIVLNNGCLKISCSLSMPQNAKIIINSGGKVIIDNGNILSKNFQWQGIEVQNGGYLELSNTSISDYSITVLNGGTLKIKDNVTIAGNNKIDIMSGAYVCIENNAIINLQDILSVLNLHNGYIFGLNPAIGNSTNCINNIASINKTGNGSINLYTTNVYIQNQTFNNNTYISGNNISAGNNVTTTRPQGPVVIQNGANVVFDADGTLLLDKGFEVQLGAYFEAR